ncbi:MAG: thioredoxin domain-containing protein [Acidobacteriota bacterium]
MNGRIPTRALACVVLGLLAGAGVSAQDVQDEARNLALGFLPYKPASVAQVTVNHDVETPAGRYLSLSVLRTSLRNDKNPDQLNMIVDPQSNSAVVGMVFPLPAVQPPVTAETLPAFVEQALPSFLQQLLGGGTRVHWPVVPIRPGPVVNLTADVQTGYGMMKMPIAVTADGKWLALGGSWPLDRDPRAVRRELLASATVEWDPGHDNAPLKVIEFSDYECPACKRGWGEVAPIFASFGAKLRHGVANFPLVANHPWAFRAAVAGVCISQLWPDKLLAFKEDMYRLQSSLSVETLDDAVFGFLTEQSLENAPYQAFKACYMKDPAIERVLKNLELGYRLGVAGTPTYYANGEALPYGQKEWIEKRLQAILDAGGKPEKAAEITVSEPAPSPTAAPPRPAPKR